LTVTIIENLESFISSYDVLFCDIWGVLHDGVTAYKEAGNLLAQFRNLGGSVILISNAPLPNDSLVSVLAEKGVRRDSWDSIISSGDITISHITERGYLWTYRIGPSRDADLFQLLPGKSASLEDAEAIVCTGLIDEGSETPLLYQNVLKRALALKIPLVCANPDLTVDVAERRYFCAGSIAQLYEGMGGEVYWAGKPFAEIYEAALTKASQLRHKIVDRSQVLAIGDSLRTDIKGAQTAGIASLLIAAGIHKSEIMRDGSIAHELLDHLFEEYSVIPFAITDRLR
jgi:HAD superfamily hydrolase (TIGR01459 family)